MGDCPRQFGGNWQRKLWYDSTNYWRGRYDIAADEIKIEWIAANNLGGDNWAENTNAAITCSGFGDLKADFTIRGDENGIPSTIHYSDGTDSYVMESDQSHATTWSWENKTKVFDGVADSGTYTRINLAACRDTNGPFLHATSVFEEDDPGTNIWIKHRHQTTALDITGWDVVEDISLDTNEDAIYGQGIRSMAEAGVGKKDMISVWKQGVVLNSRYFDSPDWEDIQTIEATTISGAAMFDLEHGLVAGKKEAHVVFVDGDGTIQWVERLSGSEVAWSNGAVVCSGTTGHGGVGILEYGDGTLYILWKTNNELEYRTHDCDGETWDPILANDPYSWDPSTQAVVNTTTIFQPQNPDQMAADGPVLLCWIGQIDADPCEIGWGIFISSSSSSESSSSSSESSSSSSESSSSSSESSSSSSSSESSSSSSESSSSSSSSESSSSSSESSSSSSESSSSSSSSESPPTLLIRMKSLREEDTSLHHYIKNYVLQAFIEEEEKIPLSYLADESITPPFESYSGVSYVYEAQSNMDPSPVSKGRGWVYLDNPSDTAEQTNTVVVYDSEGTVISGSNYMVDYVDGRIICGSSSIVPASVDYRWHYVSLVNEWMDVQAADVPVIAISISGFTKQGFQLGSGKFVSRRVDLNIFASDQAEKDDISETLYDGLYLMSCSYYSLSKGTMIDWDGTFNSDYPFDTIDGSSNLKFDNVESRTIKPTLMVPSRDSVMLSDLNRYRSRISFDMIHWEEAW